MAIAVIIIYTLALFLILLYSLAQLHLLLQCWRERWNRRREKAEAPAVLTERPFVTIQLPVYNERYVVQRLIDTVADFDYPRDRFEIQVLDDSTDDSVGIAARRVEEIRRKGVQIFHIRRKNRNGFKAGALQEGLKTAKGEFIAIFDADFLPRRDFLLKTLPHFRDPEVGIVQTRWGHINQDYSLLTRLQAFALDAHFAVEQQGRSLGGFFLNFNGSAGIWRRAAIEEAGGWEGDTLTEDLDLSFRAQLKGWKFAFVGDHESPAELPVSMDAIRSQQFRWCKGPAENVRKNFLTVLRSELPLPIKIHACLHLLNSSVFVCLLVSTLLSVPLLIVQVNNPELNPVFRYSSVFILSMVCVTLFYWSSRRRAERSVLRQALSFALTYPLFLCITMGLSLHNGIAVLEGYIGKKTPFIRTPKFNIHDFKEGWSKNTYISGRISALTLIEGLLALYFLGGAGLAFYYHYYALLPVHLMLVLGYGMIFFFSIRHALQAHALSRSLPVPARG